MFNVNLPRRILRLWPVAHHLAEEVDPHLATTIFHVTHQTRAYWSGRRAQDFITRLSGTAGLFALPFPLLRLGEAARPAPPPSARLRTPQRGRSRGPPVGVCGPRPLLVGCGGAAAAGWLCRGCVRGRSARGKMAAVTALRSSCRAAGRLVRGAGTPRAAPLPDSQGVRNNARHPRALFLCSCRPAGAQRAPRLCKYDALADLPPRQCPGAGSASAASLLCSARVTESLAVPGTARPALHRHPQNWHSPARAAPGVPSHCPCSL